MFARLFAQICLQEIVQYYARFNFSYSFEAKGCSLVLIEVLSPSGFTSRVSSRPREKSTL